MLTMARMRTIANDAAKLATFQKLDADPTTILLILEAIAKMLSQLCNREMTLQELAQLEMERMRRKKDANCPLKFKKVFSGTKYTNTSKQGQVWHAMMSYAAASPKAAIQFV